MIGVGSMGRVARFAAQLYVPRARVAYHGFVRRDPVSLLMLGPGRRDPYPIYEVMRARGPMTPTRLGNWATTSHVLCDRVLRDRNFGVRPDGDMPRNITSTEFDLSMLERNPPDHTRLRRLAAPAFGRKQLDGYRPRIEQTVKMLLDAATTGSDSFDLVSSYAAPLPIAVITDLLGVPDADAGEFAQYGATIGSALDGIHSLNHARRLMVARSRLTEMFASLFELRRREPGDDVVSAVVAAEGEQITPEEMFPLCILLLVAGFETTVNLIGNAVSAFLTHPEQWELLRGDPALAAAAVEETLRFDPPVQRTARVALQATEFDGFPVHRDQWVLTLIGAANRDPLVFADPLRFDITRPVGAEHLAFSAGIHYCLGAPLARLEATIALQALAERLPRLQLAGRIRRRAGSTIRGPLRLPLRVTR